MVVRRRGATLPLLMKEESGTKLILLFHMTPATGSSAAHPHHGKCAGQLALLPPMPRIQGSSHATMQKQREFNEVHCTVWTTAPTRYPPPTIPLYR